MHKQDRINSKIKQNGSSTSEHEIGMQPQSVDPSSDTSEISFNRFSSDENEEDSCVFNEQ
jgi:hypothetical protein